MAAVTFVVKDVVSMTLQAKENLSGLLGPLVQAQPPKFGVVATAPSQGAVGVLWEDGELDSAVPVAALDLIGPPDPGEVTKFQGFMLRTNPATAAQQESPEFQGIAIAFYTRQNGDGTVAEPTATLALMRLNFFGTYRELATSTLETVDGR